MFSLLLKYKTEVFFLKKDIFMLIDRLRNVLVKQTYPIAKRFWKVPGYYHVRDGVLYLEPRDGMSAWQRRWNSWEAPVYRALTKLIKPGERILEFGSCFGEYALEFSRYAGETGRVIGIEPFPRYFACLEKTLAANPAYKDRLIFVNKVYSPTPTTVTFQHEQNPYQDLATVNGLSYQNYASEGTPTTSVEVSSMSLVDIMREYNFRPTLLFMDIEGAETKVFDELLTLDLRPRIVWEHHAPIYGEETFQEYKTKLSNAGYVHTPIDARHLISEIRVA